MKKLLILFTVIFIFYGCKDNTSYTAAALENESDDVTLFDNDHYVPNPEGVELSKDELEMIVEVNKYRERKGRSILIVSKALMHDSREQSKLMRIRGQIHGLYPKNNAAENIFVAATTAKQAMYGGGAAAYGFTHSPGHNANLLNASYKYLGVGNIPNQSRGCWTQRFK